MGGPPTGPVAGRLAGRMRGRFHGVHVQSGPPPGNYFSKANHRRHGDSGALLRAARGLSGVVAG
eukprot:6917129-Pyramimonas_sp.AAC.1